ncbi:MAG: adenylate/guanylate cyclase domain-containing protein [Chloroflexi bacterium]|nr:adenylate/guanylate cyclase domain-containing protein [Chloroflexota bacterium]
MRYAEKHYHWHWQLQSDPITLWPLISDTNRFDRDSGTPRIAEQTALDNARQKVRMSMFGMNMAYVQEPFEWTYPQRFGVLRHFEGGLFEYLRILAELTPQPKGGTRLDYKVWLRPRGLPGTLATPFQMRVFHRAFGKSFLNFDRMAASGGPTYLTTTAIKFAPGGRQRIAAAREALRTDGADPDLLDRLIQTIEKGDPILVARLRPYALADAWKADRQEVLKLCLVATRHGLLSLQWDLLCPSCRGVKDRLPTLGGITRTVHCEMCNIDFTANFERSVELTFRPNPTIREAELGVFCIGTPQDTPHVITQQLMNPGEERAVTPVLDAGRYRVRTLTLPGGQALHAEHNGLPEVILTAYDNGWPNDEPQVTTYPTLHLHNQSTQEQLFMLERMAWSDQAATASEVTMLQLFRDLFANEALRPGEQISVGSLAILFTDLRGSTRLYREIGDAPAFGLVMEHFDLLRDSVNDEGGVIIKTLGDSIMAAFPQPAQALRAALHAQRELTRPPEGRPPLSLRAGIHFGPCIAVALNDRLDYFGSTVNIASRLESLSEGDNVILSASVYQDPEVAAWLATAGNGLAVSPLQAVLKGFDQENFDLCGVKYV